MELLTSSNPSNNKNNFPFSRLCSTKELALGKSSLSKASTNLCLKTSMLRAEISISLKRYNSNKIGTY